MPFDLAGARQAGYSDAEIAGFLADKSGFDLGAATKAGYAPAEVIGFLSERSSVDHGPADDSDPLTRVSPSTPDTGAATFAATPQKYAGAGRGFVNPPDAADAGKRDVDSLESLGRGAGRSAASTSKVGTLAAVAPVIVAEKIKNALTGSQDTTGQDAMFSRFIDPQQQAVDWYSLAPDERQGFLAKVADGVGGMLADLPLMLASGGLTQETKLAQATPDVARFVETAVSRGFDAMRPIMVKAGVEKAQQVLDAGGTVQQALTSATTAALVTGYMGSQPMSAHGTVAERILTGIPVGAITSEAHRTIQNAADPAAIQQPFSVENLGVGAISNAVMAGAMGESPQARPEVRPEARPPETSGENTSPAVDPVAKIQAAGSVDEAIATAKAAVDATPVPGLAESAVPTLEQQLAELQQRKAPDQPATPAAGPEATPPVDDIHRLLQQVLSDRPAKPQETTDAGTSTALPPLDSGAAGRGPLDAGIGLAAGEGARGLSEPAMVPGDAGAGPAGEPVSRAEVGPGAGADALDAAPKLWTGRRGDGYQTQADASNALASRQRVEPQLNWKIEPRGERFVLAGYQRTAPTTTAEGWTVNRNDSGTVTIMGDPQAIGSRLQDLGITKYASSPSGVMVGLSQADAAVQALARPVSHVDAGARPVENADHAAERLDQGHEPLPGNAAGADTGAEAIPVGRPVVGADGVRGVPAIVDGSERGPDVHGLDQGDAAARPGGAGEPAEALRTAAAETAFPHVEQFDRINVGPAGYRQPHAVAADQPTFRETGVSGLDDRMREDRQAVPFNGFVADRPELALGQGDNRGVQLQFRPGSVSGREHSKPMTGDLTGREYATDLLAPRAVQAVTMWPADLKAARGLTRQRLAADFTRQDLPDGRVHFTRNGLPELAAPELEPVTFTRNPSGTLTIEADPGNIARKVLEAIGITRLVNSKKGLLVGKSDAQAAQDALSKLSGEPTGNSAATTADAIESAGPAGDRAAAPIEQQRDLFRTFLIRNGIALPLAKDFTPGVRERLAMGRTFRHDGLQMDQLAERAAEQGYIRDRHDTDGLYDLISRSVNGERVAPLYGQDGDQELQARMEQNNRMEQEQAVAAVDSLADNELADVADAFDGIPSLEASSNTTAEAAMRALGFTEQEIADAIAQESRRAQADSAGGGGAVETAAGQAANGDRVAEGQARPDHAAAADEGLSRPSREDILARQDRAQAGARADDQAQQDAARKASADAQRGDFTLTGSDRSADANPAQHDLLAEPPPVSTKPERPADQQRLVDLRKRKSVLESLLKCLE